MNRLIIVSGMGRCGTSLMMQMLQAAGVPIFEPGEALWPAFEIAKSTDPPPGWPPADAAGALKWLDPHITAPPTADLGIFLTRNHKQQAKSALKWIRSAFPILPVHGVKQIAAGLKSDERPAFEALASRCARVLEVKFEDLVTLPQATFLRVAQFLALPMPQIASQKAAAEVVSRPVECLPYLLEVELLKGARA